MTFIILKSDQKYHSLCKGTRESTHCTVKILSAEKNKRRDNFNLQGLQLAYSLVESRIYLGWPSLSINNKTPPASSFLGGWFTALHPHGPASFQYAADQGNLIRYSIFALALSDQSLFILLCFCILKKLN